MKVLVAIARICGILPSEKPSHYTYCYQISMFTITFIWSAFSTYCIANTLYNSVTTMDLFINLLSSFFLMAQGCSIQLLALCRASVWRNLYKNLRIGCHKTASAKMNTYLEVLFAHVFFFVRLIFVTWAWLPLTDSDLYRNYCFRTLNEYYCLITIMLMVHVNIIIKKKLCVMNENLRRSKCVRHVQVAYRKNLQLIDKFNSIFGNHILVIMARAIAVSLECLHNVLTLHYYSKSDYLKVTTWSASYGFGVFVRNLGTI